MDDASKTTASKRTLIERRIELQASGQVNRAGRFEIFVIHKAFDAIPQRHRLLQGFRREMPAVALSSGDRQYLKATGPVDLARGL